MTHRVVTASIARLAGAPRTGGGDRIGEYRRPHVDRRTAGLPDDPGRRRRHSSAATVHVGPGTYTEQILITWTSTCAGPAPTRRLSNPPPALTPYAVQVSDDAP
jgi:hypothetical protein